MIRAFGKSDASPSGSLSQLKLCADSFGGGRGKSLNSSDPSSSCFFGDQVQHSSGFVPRPGTARILLLVRVMIRMRGPHGEQLTPLQHLEDHEVSSNLVPMLDRSESASLLFPQAQETLSDLLV
jgi:hypothetical protein